ncbi:DUF262 domain-containing protein [Cellulomonas chengniuliangii]|uniref:DUF262 domain-containing HNH endonuclease family protein n=1 Tax=Cellulomonas chengniuliangii TaxID=2968084 RepID=A0ABY5L1I3_9CELL|nr:DUF262 domain-containing protein [Cellulomonas chengniuliangii]MCC2307865.1 DUF262 domain-containing HNH endonuclease family protein [Cellulomonas chengniuliangii]UUI75382.1 DUF262 domain-containing HNH endonuclease family protein [Cellulomonas chengniuliangii]
MDAKTYPLQEILKPERRYIIPTFQRDYEWTLDGQWKLLFEDLESTADRLVDARASQSENSAVLKNKEQNVTPHFLGAIVCASLPFATGGVALRSVIDGQQRLTTIQLLVRGLLDVLQETGSDRRKSVRRMLFNPDDVVDSPEEVHKLWPRRRDREVWPTAMADVVPAYAGSKDHLYLRARRYFAEAVRESARNDSGELDSERLQALADALSSLFKLVVIDLEDNDDAQVIFEVLNGRQTPLAAIDLVKNLLFLRGELANEDVDRLYDTYWAGFDDDWWKAVVGRGHAARGRRDVLLSVWLTGVSGEEANVSHLYREAREYLNGPGAPDTEHVLRELSDYAKAYRAIYGAEAVDPRLHTSYDRLNEFEITTAVPLLAWLRLASPELISLDDEVRAVRAVESWAMRRSYVGWQTRGYGTHLARVLRAAKNASNAGKNVGDAVVDALQDGALAWPSDAEVREAFRTRPFYNAVAQYRLRALFRAIDDQLRNEDPHEPPAAIGFDGLQIEHVLPRSWTTHWPLIGVDGTLVDPDARDAASVQRVLERRQALDRLGNLTLVTQAFNLDVSNLGWTAKRPEFAKQGALVINKGIAAVDDWTESEIDARGAFLAAVATRVWPGPVALGGTRPPSVAPVPNQAVALGSKVVRTGSDAPVPGQPVGSVAPLVTALETVGMRVADADAPWPGWGIVVKCIGGSAYLNRTNVDVRSDQAGQIATWAAAGQGEQRGAYLRIALR